MSARSRCSTGDRLLICSDGLSGVVPHEKLESIVSATHPVWTRRARRLIDAANDAGGPDNITVAVLKVDVA